MSDEKHTGFNDVGRFHEKFALPVSGPDVKARMLTKEEFDFRSGFMHEELTEFDESFEKGDMAGMADALIDLAYVVYGTAHFMGIPWERLWADVQRANMSKERASGGDDSRSKRKSAFDVVKPEGWVGPDPEGILEQHNASVEEK